MMNYLEGTGDLENWIITESAFKSRYQGKCEAIFCLGNGYMGLRSATEERYIDQVRNFFVAGTFNKPSESEVTELPNAADCIGMDIYLNDERFSLEKGTYSNYRRSLNLKTGELNRTFDWEDPQGNSFRFSFRRMVSMKDRHLFAADISITPLDKDVSILVKSGINGQMTNSGAQHFEEGEKRIFEGVYLQLVQKTTQSNLDFVHNTTHDFRESDVEVSSRFEMDRRKVLMVYEANLKKNQALCFSKISNVYTSRDREMGQLTLSDLRTFSVEQLKKQSRRTYQELLNESAGKWGTFWDRMDLRIESEDSFDQLAIRFAQYHLLIMAPRHDSRFGIAAKGLSGEGYKGHSFWDTEIFMLPFFIYTFPEIARSLLEYRFNTLEGARKKARENGYRGAMYPWESAWADDGEVTPVWGAADIITGKSTKIWSGFIEQHITSDVAFGVWQYYQITGDQEFMDQHGYEILLDTGIFWASRLEWNDEKKEYHINDVVGPDEYKEHVNNDAFTNHTAKWCMENTIHLHDEIKAARPQIFDRLNKKLNLEREIPIVKKRVEKIYIPSPNSRNIIPQDDTYLSKRQIDLSQYKNQRHVGSIFRDYNLDQVNEIQVSKQASVVMLLYLLEHKFSKEVKIANYHYYESRTLHDSSLSLSTHAVLASDIGNLDLAYELFRKAAEIDLGSNMKSSDHGIHAASLGGIWQIVVCGFGGLRMIDGKLRIDPHLPKKIKSISYPIYWRGQLLRVHLTNQHLSIKADYDKKIELEVNDQAYVFEKELVVDLTQEKRKNGMIKGFIFDLDGVITDTAEYHYLAWRQLADDNGWYFDREINEKLRGVSRLDSIRIILDHNHISLPDRTMQELANQKNEIYIKSLDSISSDDYLPGAKALLNRLKEKGIKIGLGSASKNASLVLEKLGALHYFAVVGDGNSVSRSKPAPDIFLHVARELHLEPSECIVYEDAQSGIDAAKAGGFNCVGIGPEGRVGHADCYFPDMQSANFDTIAQRFHIKQGI